MCVCISGVCVSMCGVCVSISGVCVCMCGVCVCIGGVCVDICGECVCICRWRNVSISAFVITSTGAFTAKMLMTIKCRNIAHNSLWDQEKIFWHW